MLGKPFLESYGSKLFSRSVIAGWLIASGTLVLTGPFGTYESFSLDLRCIYWLVVVGASLIIGIGIETAVRITFPDLAPWPETLVVGTLLTLLFTPFLYAFTLWLSNSPVRPVSPFFMAGVVFAVPIVHRALVSLVYPSGAGQRAPVATREVAGRPRLLRRIDDDAVETVAHLSVRDHYVDVFTNAGKRSLLMRFSDAVNELEDVAGLRVHRSHWVALDVIDRFERDGGRTFLRLRCGHIVPVSRAYRADVERALLASA